MSDKISPMLGETSEQDFPFAGVRILDLTRLLPGPLCTLSLADLGADVIKIEDPQLGDYARWIPPLAKTTSYIFLSLNRNKRSLALNLSTLPGKEIFLKLVKSADVVVESFRPGVLKKLGLDYETLKGVNPRLVYCSLSGYGQTGPMSLEAGHDINYLALTGVLDQIGQKGGPPVIPNFQIADLAGGSLQGAFMIAAALLRSKLKGLGSYLDISLSDGVLSLSQVPMAFYNDQRAKSSSSPEMLSQRGEGLLTGGFPCYRVYETQDGRFMALGALEEKFWVEFCREIDREDLKPFALAKGEKGQWAHQEVEGLFKEKDFAYWRQKFSGKNCCCTPVLTFAEALEDPQIKARGIIQETQHSREGEFLSFSPPVKEWGTQNRQEERQAPFLGEHTQEILTELGYSEEQLKILEEEKHIKR